jgi:hypothetical protein
MNSASRGLRPTVGLRRPKNIPCVGGGRRSTRSALRGRFQSAQGPSADGRLVRRMNSASRGLRPTVGLRRPGGVFCVGGGRRPACQRLGRPISIGAGAFGRRSACADRRIPLCVGEGRRSARKRLRGRFQSAQSLRPMVGLRRPKNIPCVGEGRRSARKRLRGRFQSARGPSKAPDVAAGGIPLHTGGQTMRRPSPGERAVGAPAFPQEGVPAGNDPHRRGRLQDVGRPLRREKVPFVGSGHRDGGGPPHGCGT